MESGLKRALKGGWGGSKFPIFIPLEVRVRYEGCVGQRTPFSMAGYPRESETTAIFERLRCFSGSERHLRRHGLLRQLFLKAIFFSKLLQQPEISRELSALGEAPAPV